MYVTVSHSLPTRPAAERAIPSRAAQEPKAWAVESASTYSFATRPGPIDGNGDTHLQGPHARTLHAARPVTVPPKPHPGRASTRVQNGCSHRHAALGDAGRGWGAGMGDETELRGGGVRMPAALLHPQPSLLRDGSVVHPRGDAVSREAAGVPQSRRAHGEVGDHVPQQRDELRDGRDQGQYRFVQLQPVS